MCSNFFTVALFSPLNMETINTTRNAIILAQFLDSFKWKLSEFMLMAYETKQKPNKHTNGLRIWLLFCFFYLVLFPNNFFLFYFQNVWISTHQTTHRMNLYAHSPKCNWILSKNGLKHGKENNCISTHKTFWKRRFSKRFHVDKMLD